MAVESLENKVAFGMVFPSDGEMSNKIHGKPMPPGCVRVSVDGCLKPDALIPVPVEGEMETVSQAVGSHVAWPENLIAFPTPVVCIHVLNLLLHGVYAAIVFISSVDI